MLHFAAKPPVTSAAFMWSCQEVVSGEVLETLRGILGGAEYKDSTANPTLARWRAFDIALKNELVKVRAERKHVDPAKFMRAGGETDLSTNHIAINAYRALNPHESERILDAGRWRALDELASGHSFDLDSLFVYAVKLAILEKWALIESADKPSILEEALAVT